MHPLHSIFCTVLAGALAALAASGGNPARPTLLLVSRVIKQDQGAWVIDYQIRHVGQTGLIVTPEEITTKVEGWVSNSRIASHAVPRWSSLSISRSQELSAAHEVIGAVDEAHRCRERLVVSIWTEHPGPPQFGSGAQDKGPAGSSFTQTPGFVPPAAPQLLSLGPGSIVHIRLRLDHQHILYGDYDPLLGTRTLEVALGAAVVRDVVPLDREQYIAQPKFTWPEPPEERRDTRHALSGPDSLHLEAHVPGHQYYRYPEHPVRYNTKMRLRFWYLIAAGTEGECRARLVQYKDTPISWRVLDGGGFDECLRTVGRWTKVERVLHTEPEATVVTLEFKIVGDTDVGEMWIDDLSLEPIGCVAPGRP